MSPLILFVVSNAALNFTYCSLVRASQTATKLHYSSSVNMTKNLFIFRMSENHISNQLQYNLNLRMTSQSSVVEHLPNDAEQGKRIGDFILGKTIGQGTFNKVKIARHIHSNEQVAIKLIEKKKIETAADKSRLAKELKILRKVRHPNIIQLYQILEDQRYFYVVTEYASRGELFEHIVKNQKLTQFQASKIFKQMLDAIEYLHELGVVHRDLKPENILLDYKYNVKIIDFGLSNIYSRGQTLNTACGSPCYAAPEMLSGKQYNPLRIDIWSLGIILYAMCVGYLPFDHSDSPQLYKLIKSGSYQLPQHASNQLSDILKWILEVDPDKRATIQEIRNHKFCKFTTIESTPGIIQGLSVIPFQQHIEKQIKQLQMDVSQLRADISNNKHNSGTSTYYLLLQQWLRQKNESTLSYYNSKNSIINRYKIIEKVKSNYQKRLIIRLEQLRNSRQERIKSSNQKSSQKKRSKTVDKKYNTGIDLIRPIPSKDLFASPPRKIKSKQIKSSTKRQQKQSKRKLKRS